MVDLIGELLFVYLYLVLLVIQVATWLNIRRSRRQVDQLRAAIAELREAKATKASPPLEKYDA